ncbi:P-selectin glycoprotein ligand 1 [Echinops telfairi]|uniref:P-selectin glycoprotein ligand 1 n=1 Tax=Echinops telfairi TaxID=9371 RepID=A0AC55DM20_ECHTE|nr:P-selectin glycoprotein ligand 1 [Echinops telfairi]
MSLKLLLLLTLLGPGCSFQGASGPLLARARRQGPVAEDPDFDDEDYDIDGNTDPPEMLENHTQAVTLGPKPLTTMRTLEQRGPPGPGTPEPTTEESITRDSASLGAGGAATGGPSTELISPGGAGAQDRGSTELTTIALPVMEAQSTVTVTRSTATEALTTLPTEPPTTEALPTGPPTTEALPTEPATTRALSTEPTTTEARSTEAGTTEALPMESITTEALSTETGTTEALSMEPLSTEPATTGGLPVLPIVPEKSSLKPSVVSTERATTEARSTKSATTTGPTVNPPVVPGGPGDITTATNKRHGGSIKQWEDQQALIPRSSASPTPPGGPNSIPVRQCLLAILVLALVATIFLVCTVVLAVRLSRKNHRYPVRSYSPTEMVCISALLPDGGEASNTTPMANGGPPTAKSQGQKPEDRDGDDLTLHSFLP